MTSYGTQPINPNPEQCRTRDLVSTSGHWCQASGIGVKQPDSTTCFVGNDVEMTWYASGLGTSQAGIGVKPHCLWVDTNLTPIFFPV